MKRKLIFIFLSINLVNNNAQKIINSNLKLHNFFDNREYFNNYTEDKTIFGFNAEGIISFLINETNSIKIGLNYLQEFGKRKINTPDIIAFYEFNNKNFNITFGAFPFFDYIDQPLILFNDTLQYYKPIFEGIFLQYKNNNLSNNIWIDWVQKQDTNKKETFIIGSTFKFSKKWFNYRHDLQFIHKALPLNPAPDEHIIDNGGIVSTLGINFHHWIKSFDTLTLNSGISISYYRERTITPLLFYYAFYSQFTANFKNFGLMVTYHNGDGHNLIFGDHFYLAKNYIRLDLFYKLNFERKIEFQLRGSFHFIEKKIDNSQLIKLIVKI